MARKKVVAVVEDQVDSEIYGDFIPDDEEVQISATSGYKDVHSYDESGALVPIGKLRYRDFETLSGTIRALSLESIQTGKEHPMGNVSRGFSAHSHAQVLRPFLSNGFVMRKSMYNGSGSEMIATLARPDITFEDLITWDRSWVADNAAGFNADGTTMELAVRIKSDLHAGRATIADVGFFRIFCTNGAVSETLGLGHFWANHRNFSATRLLEFANSATISLSEMNTAPTELLDDVLDVLDRIDAEAAGIPRLLREPALALSAGLKGGRADALKDNLRALRAGQDTMSKLDLVNAQTNMAHTSKSPWSVYSQTDQQVKQIIDLVELAGVKRDIPVFEFSAN